MRKIRFAVVGTNFISDNFVDAVISSGVAEISAVFSRKLDTGRLFAEKHGLPKIYIDYAEMLADADIDAIYVASPTICHYEHTLAALRAGKHVLCEKMICTSTSQLIELRDEARERGLVLLEAMRPDFDPAYDAIRENLAKIGKIRRATLEFCQYSSRYDRFLSGEVLNAFDPTMKNSALADIGIYPLHMAHALFGEPLGVHSSAIFLRNGFEGAGNITLEYDGALVSIIYSKISDSVNSSVIEGERGSILIDKISAPTRITLCPRRESPKVIWEDSLPNNMVFEVRAFASMVDGASSPCPYLDISEMTLRTVEESYRQTGADEKMKAE